MNHTLKKLSLGTSLVALALSGAMGTTQAQDVVELEEIVVTATKRSTTLQDVPLSINAQTETDIRRSGAQNIEDLAANVAGLMIQNLGPGQSQVAIRGVSAGQIVRDQPGVKEQVGVYLDESVISLSLFTPDLDFYDLNRVETLRGPQGSLFGSGSVGGTIRYITNQPELGVNEGSVELDFNALTDGDMGGHAKGMINAPLGDNAALRVVAYRTQYAGYIDALREDGDFDKDVNDGDRTGGRMSILWQPNDMVSITPRVIFQKINMDGFNRQEVFNLYANPYTTDRTPVQLRDREQFLLLDEGFEDETMIADLTAEISFSRVDLTSVSSYNSREILVSRDASALTGSVSVDLGYPDEAVMLPSNLRDTTDVESFTQELRLSSNDDGPVQWIVGGFYSSIDRFYRQYLPTPGYDTYTDQVLGDGTAAATRAGVAPVDSPFYSELPYDLEQMALFGEASYEIDEQWEVTAGGRFYDYNEERSVTQVGLFGNGVVDQVDKTSASGFSPRFIVSYDMSEQVSFNAQVSKGFRLGGVNDPLNTALCNAQDLEVFGDFQAYDDETLWNYEAGVKVNTGIFSLNAAAFRTQIKNLQVTLDAGSCSSRISFNVPKAHTMGLEFEMKARPNQNLTLSLASSLVESEFDSTVLDSNGAVLGGVREGNRLASVPKFNIGATATYTYPIDEYVSDADFFMSATIQHRSSLFTQPGDQEAGAGTFVSGLPFGGAPGTDATVLDLELDGYSNVNFNTGIMTADYEVQVYINNLFDENANLSFDRERGGRARLGFRTNQPRTFGITFRKFF